MNKSIQHLANVTLDNEWETDPGMLNDACAKFGIFPELDVACKTGNKKCNKGFHLDALEDAMIRDWDLDFFMNPPYSQVEQWIAKAYYEHRKHNVNALSLVYSKTDTKWWHKYVEGKAEVHFIEGRIKFLKNGVKSKNSAPYPSCWIIYRKKSNGT